MAIKSKKEAAALNIVDQALDVILTITIGNAQIGGSVVYFKDAAGNIIGKGDISKLSIGSGNQLKGLVLSIDTNILDSNPSSLGVVANYYFTNCTPPSTMFHDSLDNPGDIFNYHIEFSFL